MPRKKGLTTTTKNVGGRPPKFKPRFNQQIIEFFTRESYKQVVIAESESESTTAQGATRRSSRKEFKLVPNEIPYFEDFAAKIEVHHDTLLEWSKSENEKKYPGFSGAYLRAKHLQKKLLIELGMAGISPPGSFMFVAKNITDMVDEQNTNVNILALVGDVRNETKTLAVQSVDRKVLSD